jgi:hypothetical protein
VRLANCGKQVCFCPTWKFYSGLTFHRDARKEANDMQSYVMRYPLHKNLDISDTFRYIILYQACNHHKNSCIITSV